nr:fibrinogen domain-containing type 2 protein 2 [Arenicola marina]
MKSHEICRVCLCLVALLGICRISLAAHLSTRHSAGGTHHLSPRRGLASRDDARAAGGRSRRAGAGEGAAEREDVRKADARYNYIEDDPPRTAADRYAVDPPDADELVDRRQRGGGGGGAHGDAPPPPPPPPPAAGSASQDPSTDTGTSSAAQDWSTKLEHRLQHHIREAEKRIGRRLGEKLGALNQSLTLRHLQRLYHHVSEEVQLAKEAGEERAAAIQALNRYGADQQTELERLQATVAILQDTVEGLADLVTELSSSGGPRPAGGDVTPPAQLQMSTAAEVTTPRNPSGGSDVTHAFSPFPADCNDMYEKGTLPLEGDHYMIIQSFRSPRPIKVICREVNGAGWTLIQRRDDGEVDFFRNWEEYKTGFGSLETEFWLGNENIHHLTNQGNYRLRIEMEDFEGERYWAEYEHFQVESEDDFYRLHIHGYHGNAGDSLTSRWNNHDGMPFSTKDRDNDNRFYDNCADLFNGAWWFANCFESHLNGVYYLKGKHNNFFVRNGIQWNTIHRHSSLRAVVMMVKPNDSPSREPGPHDNRLSNDIQ